MESQADYVTFLGGVTPHVVLQHFSEGCDSQLVAGTLA